ncbi:hypothetical protein KPB2_5572 [Klebsiella pneumoniae Kb677]|nr:hypothetical protein KPB2_5572 [Klebsiella pneumoniae Kb677]
MTDDALALLACRPLSSLLVSTRRGARLTAARRSDRVSGRLARQPRLGRALTAAATVGRQPTAARNRPRTPTPQVGRRTWPPAEARLERRHTACGGRGPTSRARNPTQRA